MFRFSLDELFVNPYELNNLLLQQKCLLYKMHYILNHKKGFPNSLCSITWSWRWNNPAERYLFVKTREAAPIEVLTPPSLIKKWDKRTPEQLGSRRLLFSIFFCPRSYSEVQEDVFAGKWLVALWTLESWPINCWPGACIIQKNINVNLAKIFAWR